ncbi:Rhodanese-like protein [Sulfitobacter noctilucicola]|uniref:Rhodanese-related sulfurtransferase n=1 Tax=Sulfitobacter noctilucicola TaxID=1342301 RepID=A0A7W6M4H1_9RHOB|nr:rhodanese-like domain-containing protein [Sulfitobacter noctilucicola]KIN63187.1 Rhodanese-like protein [Sulfitobacter noctilucicola]MBB4172288.1 rhodanese-related sulfurtransferase [Sulfitobacter noctilucicola]
MPSSFVRAVSALTFCATGAVAQEQLTQASASFLFNGQQVTIARDAGQSPAIAQQFTSSTDSCGGSCIAPMQAAPGVTTLGELEVMRFLSQDVAGGQGLMVDARVPQDRAKGFIPGSVNLPFSTLDSSNAFRSDILRAIGAREFDGLFNFSDARTLLVYDSGPTSDDAHRLISNLLDAGYPPEMLMYYRGGMQVWAALGFSIQTEGS